MPLRGLEASAATAGVGWCLPASAALVRQDLGGWTHAMAKSEQLQNPRKQTWKCLHTWWWPRSSKPSGRTLTVRSVGSIPMHFRHFLAELASSASNSAGR